MAKYGSGARYGSGTQYAGISGGGGGGGSGGGGGGGSGTTSVAIAEKHNSYIAYAFRYQDEKGDLVWEKGIVTYDPDLVAHVRGISVDFLGDGEVIPYFAGDEDSVRIYYEISLNTTAADPTTASSYVDAQSGAPGATGVFAKYGDRVSIKARAQASNGVLGPVLPKVFVRGDTENMAPTFQVKASRTGGVVTITIDGQDPTASMTAWDFSYRFPDGAGGYNTATNSTAWTTNNWNTGDRNFTSTLQITVPQGVSGDVYCRATHTDEAGNSREKGFTVHLSDIDEVNKTVRVPGSAFTPADDQDVWNRRSGVGGTYLLSATGAHPVYSYYGAVAPVILADAVEIDNIRAYGKRVNAGDYLEVGLWQSNGSAGSLGFGRVGSGIFFGTGGSWQLANDASNPVNWTLDYGTVWLGLVAYLLAASSVSDVGLAYVQIEYTAYSYEATF